MWESTQAWNLFVGQSVEEGTKDKKKKSVNILIFQKYNSTTRREPLEGRNCILTIFWYPVQQIKLTSLNIPAAIN